MGYVYRVTRLAYRLLCWDAQDECISPEKYVTQNYGFIGTCVKVEVM